MALQSRPVYFDRPGHQQAVRRSEPHTPHELEIGASPMRAVLMYGAGDVRVENVPDSVIKY
ncbi:hypothetical protein, partial [Streptomyces sp. NPDC058108]|uniref:hypothetical protein n=1 Tax=Streptomyces sp. NPDC058108 TaxID=3346344 RepID=UPI0036DFD3C8